MAERIVNSGIKFAYISSNIEIELKKELEKYFLFQNVLIYDSHFEFGKVTEKLQKNTKCLFTIIRNLESIKNIENFSCIIIVNTHNLNELKLIAKNNNIPYILSLTDLSDGVAFKNHLITDDFKIIECNFPIGITLSTDYIFDYKSFISKAVLEISSLSFLNFESNILKLFFSEFDVKNDLSYSKKILKNLQKNAENNQKIDILFKKIANLYVSYAIFIADKNISLLDCLLKIYNINQGKEMHIEAKYIFSLLVTSLFKNFFLYWTPNLKETINYEVHQNHLTKLNKTAVFKPSVLVNNKINYLIFEFREKLIDYTTCEISFKKLVKNMIAEIDVDYLYKVFYRLEKVPFTDYINLNQDLFNKNDILTILYNVGLLNFDF